jgi:spore germination protein GerM
VPLAVALALVALVAGAAACGGGGATTTTAAPATAARQDVTVFFLNESGTRLVREERSVPAGPDSLTAALGALADGPAATGLVPAVPEGARLVSASREGTRAVLDWSPGFETGYPSGGAAAETAVIGPIVATATAVPGVREVLLTVEGRAPQTLGGQFDLSDPLTRADLPSDLLAAP